jgi:Co/Zn/Cd efflux system component
MYKTVFHIRKMDCQSEESLIRMKLDGMQEIKQLDFNLKNHRLTVIHSGDRHMIEILLKDLDLGTKFIETSETIFKIKNESDKNQSKLLWIVLIINLSFFVIEFSAGFLYNSMGLVADSLDMLADSIVYGLSLWAVGSAITRKKKVATLSGYFQLTLALAGLVEVIRRFIGVEALPDFRVMIVVSLLALIANSVCLYLLQKAKSEDAHMRASMIFTSNDIIINAGVIAAGILVLVTRSKYPDLVVGAIVFMIVVRGAMRILNLGK